MQDLNASFLQSLVFVGLGVSRDGMHQRAPRQELCAAQRGRLPYAVCDSFSELVLKNDKKCRRCFVIVVVCFPEFSDKPSISCSNLLTVTIPANRLNV